MPQRELPFEERALLAVSRNSAREADAKAKQFEIEYAHSDEVIKMPNKTEAFARIEQNLMDLPVCVANRKEVDRDHIIVDTGPGKVWKISAPRDGHQAPPEYYSYFLWFLDKMRQIHYEARVTTGIPRMVIDPRQIYEDVELPKILMAQQSRGINTQLKKVSQPGGSYYKKIHEIFTTFARLEVSTHEAWHDKRGNKERLIKIDTYGQHLCHYSKWVNKNSKGDVVEEGAIIAPGPIVWESIKQNYTAGVPFSIISQIPGSPAERYLIQRLYVYLTKHLYTLKVYPVSMLKLLAKIPMSLKTKPYDAERKLHDAHDYLVKQGLLAAHPKWEGRGMKKQVVYTKAA